MWGAGKPLSARLDEWRDTYNRSNYLNVGNMDYMFEFIEKLYAEEKNLHYGKTREEHAAYNKAMAELNDKFKEELFKDLCIEDNPKRDLLFQKAWDSGHASGWHEVWNHAVELVDLIK